MKPTHKINDGHVLKYAQFMEAIEPQGAVRIAIHPFCTWIDANDADVFERHSWHLKVNKKSIYVVRTCHANNDGGRKIALHRSIMGDMDGLVVDHINGNTLDNRRSNLRHVSTIANAWNKDFPNGAGVHPHITESGKITGRWRASISFLGKWKNLGLHDTMAEAIAARAEAERSIKRELGIG